MDMLKWEIWDPRGVCLMRCRKGTVLFDVMPGKNLVSWNAMIGGYCQNKQPHEALKLFHELQSSTIFEPNEITVVSILPAIATLGALELGEWVHLFVQRMKLDRAVNVCTSLVDISSWNGRNWHRVT
uniref:Pentatricopeptide repeat-containing protein n=1 Tax=Salix viminalis TaxID=40686 RepID=A0A6N2MQC3_SALVM